MGDIVEHVKGVIAFAELTYMSNLRTNANNDRFKVGVAYHAERPSDVIAKAAIRATLEYLRENVSDNMSTAMRLASWNIQGGYGGPSPWEAAISAALNDIEGGTG